MPVWLVNLLTGLLTPIVERILNGTILNIRIDRLEKNQAVTIDTFSNMQKAQTDEERDAALSGAGSSWNHP